MKKVLILFAALMCSAFLQAEFPFTPDNGLTPGDVLVVSSSTICVPGYASKTRKVSKGLKKKVYVLYNIDWEERSSYEVDHLISLQLGGSNDIKNLWPQAYEPRPGAHEKDAVENYLHRQVCKNGMPLSEAQNLIINGWVKIYDEMARRK